jgi:hypothetical protein
LVRFYYNNVPDEDVPAITAKTGWNAFLDDPDAAMQGLDRLVGKLDQWPGCAAEAGTSRHLTGSGYRPFPARMIREQTTGSSVPGHQRREALSM